MQPVRDVSPFAIETKKPLVARRGARNGYIMLATSERIEHYADWPDSVFTAAKAWAVTLEQLGSPRVYWITLSEAERHLHIHLFPRWPQDALKGIALFETRDNGDQTAWTPQVESALRQWAEDFQAEILPA